ncbi:MAG: hypothetical protein M3R03_05750 [Pseudomonadota bacterium]|nr:hypothetical protein [Pseudomonadota bacterium]
MAPALLAAATGVFLCAQAPPVFSSGIAAALDGFSKGAYFKSNEALADLAFAPDGEVRDRMAFGLWTQFSTLLTNELDLDVLARGGHASNSDPMWAQRLSAAEPRDAIKEIVARARNTNIVILNEAHNSPRDRAFALHLARALRPLGYKTLALETFSNNPPETGLPATDQLKRDGFVRFNTGGYTIDPVFARFVREALALGYEPVAYEQTKAQDPAGSGIAEREQAQADNLMRKIFSARPKEKVFIFVGWGHVVEHPAKQTEWMAARLKRMSGVDPLTIDQTSVTDMSNAREAYEGAAARIGKSSVFFEGADPLLIGRIAGVDLQVIHPRRSYRSGRPAWLVDLGGKQVPIPKQLLPAKGRRLIQVFAADAPSDAVPLDQVLVTATSPAPVLFVPAGSVRFAIQQ